MRPHGLATGASGAPGSTRPWPQSETACSDFRLWSDLRDAGFPPYPRPEAEADYDPRTGFERADAHEGRGRRLLEAIGVPWARPFPARTVTTDSVPLSEASHR